MLTSGGAWEPQTTGGRGWPSRWTAVPGMPEEAGPRGCAGARAHVTSAWRCLPIWICGRVPTWRRCVGSWRTLLTVSLPGFAGRRACAVSLSLGHALERPGGPSSGVLGPPACPWKRMPLRCCSDPRETRKHWGDVTQSNFFCLANWGNWGPDMAGDLHGPHSWWIEENRAPKCTPTRVLFISPLPASLDIVLMLSNAGNWCTSTVGPWQWGGGPVVPSVGMSNAGNWCRSTVGALTMGRGTCGSQCWHVKCWKLMQKYCGALTMGRGACGSECWNVIYTESKWGRRTY